MIGSFSVPFFDLGSVPANSEPFWLRELLGDDFFVKVMEVGLNGTGVTDAKLENLEGLTDLPVFVPE